MALRYLTAGESHGQGLVVIVEGLPAGLPMTVAQVQARLGDLSPAQLRKVRDYERRHANRKTVLDDVASKLD